MSKLTITSAPQPEFGNLCDFAIGNILCHLQLEDLASISDASKRFRTIATSVFDRIHSRRLISFDATILVPWDAKCDIKPVSQISDAITWFKLLRNFGHSMKNVRIESEYYDARPMRRTWMRMFRYFSRYCRLNSMETLELRNCPEFFMEEPMTKMQQFYGNSLKMTYDSVNLMPNLRSLSLFRLTKSIDKHFPLLETVHFVLTCSVDIRLFILFISKNRQIRSLTLHLLVPLDNQIHFAIDKYLQLEHEDISSHHNLERQLRRAAHGGDLNRVKRVLELGANIHAAATANGWTALHWAAHNGDLDTVKFLLGKGAEFGLLEKNGKNALHIASQFGHSDVIKYLIDNGGDVNAADKNARTPLFIATMNNRSNVVRVLLENGASIHGKSEHGMTSLHISAYRGYTDIVEILLERGADIGALDDMSCTPLHRAVKPNGHLEVIRLLLQNGADITAKDNLGESPLVAASKKGDLEMVQLLCGSRSFTARRSSDWNSSEAGSSAKKQRILE